MTAPDAGERAARRPAPTPPWALVNNAGTSRARPLEELTDGDWQEQWELHVMAPMRLMRALAPGHGGGRRRADRERELVVGQAALGRLDAAYSVTKAAQLSL